MSKSAEKILIIGPAWVGDMVMAQSLLMSLKQDVPESHIDVLAPAWSRPLLERMPEVCRAFDAPFRHGELLLQKRYQLGQLLRAEKYDRAIVLPNSFKSALVPFFAKIPVRVGWRGEMRYGLLNDCRVLDKSRFPLMIQRFVALGKEAKAALPERLPYPRLQVDALSVRHAVETFNLNLTRPVLAICPGAEFGAAKRWPEEHYAAIAQRQLAAGWQVWMFGSEKDRVVTERIQSACQGACVDLAGKTKLSEAIDLLSLTQLVVSNDSGLMHIAAALERPLVVVYGSTDPRFTPPLAEKVQILSLNLSCSPCFKRECPLEHLHCLRQLEPSLVVRAMDALLA